MMVISTRIRTLLGNWLRIKLTERLEKAATKITASVITIDVDAMLELNEDEYNHILKNVYGAEALLPTTTSMHIGEFGTYIDSLTGLDQKILEKYNFQK